MIAVRCQSCARRFALFCLAPGDPCVFCGERQITERTVSIARSLVEQALGQESES